MAAGVVYSIALPAMQFLRVVCMCESDLGRLHNTAQSPNWVAGKYQGIAMLHQKCLFYAMHLQPDGTHSNTTVSTAVTSMLHGMVPLSQVVIGLSQTVQAACSHESSLKA